MGAGKVKASKARVHEPPAGVAAPDEHFHVYIYDVFNHVFMPGRSFDTIERAVQFQRHEQERVYAEQEAAPELFDLPFISSDPDLIGRTERDPEYKDHLRKELQAEIRGRVRSR